ncbi:MAG: hypothetical protein ACTSRA_00995 [Promethearchaeota archaeon]
MPVLLSHFHTRLGPRPFIVVPKDFSGEILNETAKLMDLLYERGEFFIKDDVSGGIKTINLSFEVPSAWARGKREMVQLSVFLMDDSVPVDTVKKHMNHFIESILSDADIFKGFYYIEKVGLSVDAGEVERLDDGLIKEKYDKIYALLEELNDSLLIERPMSHAYLMAFEGIQEIGMIHFPPLAVNDLRFLIDKKAGSKNVFIVFRKVGAMLKVNVVPCDGGAIRVRVITSRLTPDLVMNISKAIKLELLFTNGICQERTGKCSFEGYFSLTGDFEKEKMRIVDALKMMANIESIDISLIKMSDL